MITYYIGAGASCGTKEEQALPLVSNLPNRLNDLATNSYLSAWYKKKFGEKKGLDFSDFNNQSKPEFIPKSEKEVVDDFVSNLYWLSKHSKNHISIDTFAKKLFIRNDYESLQQLKRLEATLSTYFILEQFNRFDKRYDAFFASIIKNDAFALPSNLRIVSWNYDWQFEIAYSAFCNLQNITDIQSKLNTYSKFNNINNIDKNINLFTLLKLNGTCGFYNTSNERFHNQINKIPSAINESDELINESIKSYWTSLYDNDNKNILSSTLSFSWEDEPVMTRNVRSGIVQITKSITQQTKVLVVIGYSFPYFNRDVDREIIRSMNLDKVYIQSPDAEKIKIRFRSILPDFDENRIIQWAETDQFLIPDEF